MVEGFIGEARENNRRDEPMLLKFHLQLPYTYREQTDSRRRKSSRAARVPEKEQASGGLLMHCQYAIHAARTETTELMTVGMLIRGGTKRHRLAKPMRAVKDVALPVI